MAISLRIIIVALVVLVGVAATLIALLPVRAAGMTAVRDTAALLRVEISGRLSSDVLAFFATPIQVISSIRDQYRIGSLNPRDCIGSVAPAIAAGSQRLGLPVYTSTPDNIFCYASGAGRRIWHSNLVTGIQEGKWVDLQNFSISYRYGPGNATYMATSRPWYAAVSGYNQSWGPVYVESGSLTITTMSPGGPLRNVSNNDALDGVVVADVRNDLLLDFFRDVQIAKTGRAIILNTQQRAVLGGNWNESAVITINATEETARLATVFDLVQEPLFVNSVQALGEDTLFTAPLPYRTQYGSGLDTVYVDIVQMSDDSGLDLRLMVIIPERDFLEEVTKNVNTSIGAAVGAVIGLLFIAFIITAAVLHPLSALEKRMYCAAAFDDDEAEEASASIVSEVANIQTAYSALTKELRRIKSFLPRSLLAAIENEDEEIEAEEHESHPNQSAGGGRPGTHVSSYGHSRADRQSMRSSRVSSNNSATMSSLSRAEMNSFRSARAKGESISAALAGAKVARSLFVDDSTLSSKKVTVVAINALGTHRKAKVDWRVFKHHQSQLLTSVQTHAKKFKGIIDSFQGDRVLVTFNAVTNVPSHQSKAGHFALNVLQDFQNGFEEVAHRRRSSVNKKVGETCEEDASTATNEGPKSPSTPAAPVEVEASTPVTAPGLEKSKTALYTRACPLTIGIATSDCIVGNMGIEGLKSFNTVGAAMKHATILERLCKQYGVAILVAQSAALSMEYDTSVLALGAVELSTTAPNVNSSAIKKSAAPQPEQDEEAKQQGPTLQGKISVVYTLTGHASAASGGGGMDEWMYELKAKDENKGALLSKAWGRFLDGDLAHVKEMMKVLNENKEKLVSDSTCASATSKSLEALSQLVKRCEDNIVLPSQAIAEYVKDQAALYYSSTQL